MSFPVTDETHVAGVSSTFPMIREQGSSSVLGDTDFPFAPDRTPLSLAKPSPESLALVEQGVLPTVLDDRATSADGPSFVVGLIVLKIENLSWHAFAFGSLHPVKLVCFTHLPILAVFAYKCKNPTTRRQWDS